MYLFRKVLETIFAKFRGSIVKKDIPFETNDLDILDRQ